MLAKEILGLNVARSKEFCTPSARDERSLYFHQHPTNILVFKCMDGRINLPLITGIPMGILHPFRHIGGKFTLGDPYLGRLVLDAKDEAIREGRGTLALCTYHFSKGSPQRGCAGHGYDTAAARQGAVMLKREFEDVFGATNQVIAAIVLGIETDEDALIFCNGKGKEFVIADHLGASDDEIRQMLFALYPHMQKRMLLDLLPLALGNRDHVAAIRRQGRPVTELVHGENLICVGRGFDWLHLPNRALIIGPYAHINGTWRSAVAVAGKIVLGNFEQNAELRDHGALLLVSAPYSDIGEHGLAVAKAKYFSHVARATLAPLAHRLHLETLIGVTEMETMRYHRLPDDPTVS